MSEEKEVATMGNPPMPKTPIIMNEGDHSVNTEVRQLTAVKDNSPSTRLISVQEAVDLNAVFRGAGLTVDLIFTAIIFELCKEFMNHGSDMSIREINDVVKGILADPGFANLQKQQQEAAAAK